MRIFSKQGPARQRGFTLIEIMVVVVVVVVIIGVMGALLLPQIMDQPDHARQPERR